MVQLTHPTIRHSFTQRQHACRIRRAPGFKNVRDKDSLFNVLYIQCDDKAEAQPPKLKRIKHSVSSAAMETPSVIQATECISFRAESSSLKTCSCINVTITSFPQRDRTVSSFDLAGFHLRPGLLSLSWICSFFLYLLPLIVSSFF